MRVFIGYDRREHLAYQVASLSLRRRASIEIDVQPIKLDRCKRAGLMYRPTDVRGGRLWDEISQAYCSTEFAISRFLVPFLQHSGWALFVDCDVVFLADVAELLQLADHRKAVQVVKHDHVPTAETKMDGQAQTAYPRKNWSSVVLWNCSHPAHDRLTLGALNTLPGRTLHQFFWLEPNEIGELPAEWNWLVGDQPQPLTPKIAHFTNGYPALPGMAPGEHDAIWWDEHKLQRERSDG